MEATLNAIMGPKADKKKLGIMAGLVVALFVVIAIRILAPGSDMTDSADANVRGGSGLLDSRPEYMSSIARIARLRSTKTYTVGEMRDPLTPLVEERSAPPPEPRGEREAPVSTELPWMALHGIIWDPDNPIAIIDGLDLRVGDTIKGARVVEIGYDSVVLTYRSRRHVLTVE